MSFDKFCFSTIEVKLAGRTPITGEYTNYLTILAGPLIRLLHLKTVETVSFRRPCSQFHRVQVQSPSHLMGTD